MIDIWIIKDLPGMLNQLSLNTLTFQLIESYMDLPVELKSPRKGLINIKNKDQKCYLGCHVRHTKSFKKYPEGILKNWQKIAEKLDYDETEFLVQEKYFSKIEVKNNIYISVFDYENKLAFPIYVSDQKFEDSVNLLLNWWW